LVARRASLESKSYHSVKSVSLNLLGDSPRHEEGLINMGKKESSPKLSTLASRVLSGDRKPTASDSKRLAASVLSQDEKKGQRK
jgi:hypothetical protein